MIALLALSIAATAAQAVSVYGRNQWMAGRLGRERRWHLTPDERAAYDTYLASDETDSQAAWDAMPLWLRVAMCGDCGWLDAVWEACPELGREIDGRVNGVSTS